MPHRVGNQRETNHLTKLTQGALCNFIPDLEAANQVDMADPQFNFTVNEFFEISP
jgi:hypothetical protein